MCVESSLSNLQSAILESSDRVRSIASLHSFSNEGIAINDPLLVERNGLYNYCHNMFAQTNVVLLRSTPYSGKTAFGRLFERWSVSSKMYDIVLRLTCLDLKDLENDSIENLFQRKFKASLYDLIQNGISGKKVLLVVDEIQITYDLRVFKFESFWRLIKSTYESGKKSVKILLLGAYGGTTQNLCSTPVSIVHIISHDQLAFTFQEFNEIVDHFCDLNISSDEAGGKVGAFIALDQVIREMIFNLTAGHVGLCRSILLELSTHFSPSRYMFPIHSMDIVKYLVSSDMLNRLKSLRCVNVWWVNDSFSREIIHSVIIEKQIAFSDGILPLLRTGVLAMSSANVCGFASPILECIAVDIFYPKMTKNLHFKASLTFVEFIKYAVLNMNHGLLCNSMSVGANNLIYEAQLQAEFYRSAYGLLSSMDKIFPNVGYLFGSRGYLDFYVNGDKKWGVELTRNSSLLQTHIDRFGTRGIYSRIPFLSWVVINFVQNDNGAIVKEDDVLNNELRVVYSTSSKGVLLLWRINELLCMENLAFISC